MIKLFVDRKEIALLPPPFFPPVKGDIILFQDKHYEIKNIVHYIPPQYGADSEREGQYPACQLHLYCQTFPIL